MLNHQVLWNIFHHPTGLKQAVAINEALNLRMGMTADMASSRRDETQEKRSTYDEIEKKANSGKVTMRKLVCVKKCTP
ncbi:hypothetical protein INT45_003853 [Circinella minor]|uniref:Uncharacterized protein n=1 Tax=Circinella minor TaxID=1195481 RepID=A0A8H7VSG8_9FUNG|nr:hypothetical protein INT45_003853 [Circinella minor]